MELTNKPTADRPRQLVDFWPSQRLVVAGGGGSGGERLGACSSWRCSGLNPEEHQQPLGSRARTRWQHGGDGKWAGHRSLACAAATRPPAHCVSVPATALGAAMVNLLETAGRARSRWHAPPSARAASAVAERAPRLCITYPPDALIASSAIRAWAGRNSAHRPLPVLSSVLRGPARARAPGRRTAFVCRPSLAVWRTPPPSLDP